MVHFRSHIDDWLTAEAGESLGRLLVDYQKLESAVRSCLSIAFAAVDPLGITELWTKDLTTNRKIHVAKTILNHAATQYGVPETHFTGKYPVMIDPRDSAHAHKQVLNAFAGMRDALSNAADLCLTETIYSTPM